MSSTNRGYERHVSDYYVTPQWAIHQFLDKFFENESFSRNYKSLRYLDPASGGSVDDKPSYPIALQSYGVDDDNITTIDIREDAHSMFVGDYLKDQFPIDTPDIIITNPPFLDAQAFIERALTQVRDGGYVVMLLRLNFIGSAKRTELFDTYTPVSCYVHPKRISFAPRDLYDGVGNVKLAKGKTDSIEYAHWVWQKGVSPDFTRLYRLPI